MSNLGGRHLRGVILTVRDIVAGIDLGTSNVRVIVGEITVDNTINIIGVGTSPSEGIKRVSLLTWNALSNL